MDDEKQRKLREGAGDAFSSAFELIVTPFLFGMLGWFIDSQVGTFPIFTLGLTLIVLGYEVWRLFSRYAADMDAELEARRATYGRSGARSATPSGKVTGRSFIRLPRRWIPSGRSLATSPCEPCSLHR